MTSSQDLLVEQHLDYAQALARKIARNLPRHAEFDELTSLARYGLTEAARDFSPARGVAFTTFAYYRIRGTVLDGIKKMNWISPASRRKLAREAAENDAMRLLSDTAPADAGQSDPAALAEHVDQGISKAVSVFLLSREADDGESEIEKVDEHTPAEIAENGELLSRLLAAMKSLTSKEQSVIQLIYHQDRSMSEAGEKLGCNKSTISRIHVKALDKLFAQLGPSGSAQRRSKKPPTRPKASLSK